MIAQVPSSYANAVAPFAPLGRQAVGQENTELKVSSLKPLEQSAESGRTDNRRSPDERPNDVLEQERVREGGAQRQDSAGADQSSEDPEREAQQETEREVIRELAARDREVRAHEQAHAAVGGQYAGSPVYQYERGPDGVRYAVGGEVSISTGAIPGNPEATIAKAQQIRRAANAPAEPSPQDRRVAAEAARLETEARAELRAQEALESRQQAEQSERKQELEAEKEKEAREEAAQRQEERRAQQSQQEQARANRSEFLDESRARNIDVNRRLLDIGVFNSSPTVGRLLDSSA